MFHVHTPQPSTGTTVFLDVEFHDGVAHLDDLHPVRELALIQHGYCVVHEVVGETLESLTVPELRKLAEEEGIEIPAKAKKPEIIEALNAAPARVLTASDFAESDDTGIPGHVQNADGSFTAPGIHEE